MSPEDTRDDLIENEPNPPADELSVDEKTWGWWALHQDTPQADNAAQQINQRLYAATVAIDFLWTVDLLCLLVLSGGTRLDHSVITTKGSVSVRHNVIEQQPLDKTAIITLVSTEQ